MRFGERVERIAWLMSDFEKDDMSGSSHDPLRRASVECSTFNKFWLSDGGHRTPLQQVGYGIFSMAFICVGLFTLSAAASNFEADQIFMGIGFGFATLFFLYLGLRGLRNVFRFQQ